MPTEHNIGIGLGLLAVLLPLMSALLPGRIFGRGLGLFMMPLAAVPALLLALLAPAAMLDLPGLFLGARFGLDATGRSVLLFSALLWLAAGIHATAYLQRDSRRDRFRRFWCATLAGNVGLLLAQDAASFYVFFSLMSFSAYGLVVHSGTDSARRAGRVYLSLVVLGEVLLFAAIVLLWQSNGTLLFADLQLAPTASGSGPWPALAMACAILAFGIKAGLMPLHVWLPLAHPEAPTPASAVLSGTMIKAGLVGWIRFLPIGETSITAMAWGEWLMAAGLLAAFAGVLIGLTQRQAKAALAYSSISQMGVITLALGAALSLPSMAPGLLAAAVVYAFHHALAKAGLFLGVSLAGTGSPIARRLWLAGMVLMALALAGAPFTSGFAAKTALKAALPADGSLLPLWLGLAASGTLLLMVHCLALMKQAQPSASSDAPRGAEWVGWGGLLVLVALGGIWVSAFPSPVPHDAKAAWSGLWPLMLAGLLFALFAALRKRHASLALPRIPPGDLLMLGSFLRKQAAKAQRVLDGHERSSSPKSNAHRRRRGTSAQKAETRLARHWGLATALIGMAMAAMLLAGA